jgi:hypothetical protein
VRYAFSRYERAASTWRQTYSSLSLDRPDMLYRIYSSIGNTRGLKDYIGYLEIDVDGYFTRYLEIGSNGLACRYTRDHPVDKFGSLPEGVWDEAAASASENGSLVSITAALFAAVWSRTRCDNIGLASEG